MLIAILTASLFAQEKMIPAQNKFRQMGTEFNTPNAYRTASGAPGQFYWQQQANYKISIELDDEKQKITGKETIEYINNSPDVLTYLWVQLDQNMRQKESLTMAITPLQARHMRYGYYQPMFSNELDGGFRMLGRRRQGRCRETGRRP